MTSTDDLQQIEMPRSRILCWLDHLPPIEATGNKRKREEQSAEPVPEPETEPEPRLKYNITTYLTSPPPSSTSRSMSATPTRNLKRQRQDDSTNLDPDLTPRAVSTTSKGLDRLSLTGYRSPFRSQTDTESTSDAPSSSRSSASRSSASRSPKKAIVRLDNAPDGLQLRQLNIDAAPCDKSRKLLRRLRQVSNGVRILPDTYRHNILTSNFCCRDAEDAEEWEMCFGPPGIADTLPGQVPSIEQVEKVRRRAEACQNDGQDEAGWNANVHQALLESIFHVPGLWTRGADAFNFFPCTNARPHSAYLPDDAQAQRVDFVLVDDPDPSDDDAKKRIRAYRLLSGCTLTDSVNMTNFMPLRLRPILFAIETKPPHLQLDKANLQMGVWHAAQWSFLTSSCCHSIRAKATEDPSLKPDDVAEQAQERIEKLPFIPGIIVHGHVWSFVLSTREGSKTTLWSQRLLGTTQSVQEIFKIVAGLREVAAWCKEEYMTWWDRNILDEFLNKS